MPKPLDPDALVALSERAQRLKALTEHPGWVELRATLEERRDLKAASLASRIVGKENERSRKLPQPVSEDEILRNRLFWAGAFAVLDTPEAVESKLETATRRAQREEGES